MRRMILMAAVLAAGCAEQPMPPAAALPAPVPRSAPEQQGARRPPPTAQPSGEPGYAPFDIGGSGQGPVMPDQVPPAFRNF
ncbi:hypothetical protein [Neoroseomonas lacus]|uniref:Lipoprotein n=1 Tax=Neoroseomonas lacus TaxID=287609 RepID=A0A917K6S8_9PROT|nr:hypothetical protein [Neoroseomonas lacus]GGJ01064.1 hypothetical protein GCM10011320_04860 [Neoroseomonas lacus]